MIEVLVAIIVLLVGVVGVAQLVPKTVQFNQNARYDTASVVTAQRELDQMTQQPLSSAAFTDADGNAVNLGSTAAGGVFNGSPLYSSASNPSPAIDFTQGKVAGYSLTYRDPNDASSASYDVRWAIASTINAKQVVAKRIVIGVWKNDPNNFYLPVNLDVQVQNFK